MIFSPKLSNKGKSTWLQLGSVSVIALSIVCFSQEAYAPFDEEAAGGKTRSPARRPVEPKVETDSIEATLSPFLKTADDLERSLVLKQALELASDELEARAKAIKEHQALLLPEDMDGYARGKVVGGALELEPAVLEERAAALQKYQDVLLQDVAKEYWYGRIVNKVLGMDSGQLEAKAEAIKKHQALLLSEDMSESGRGIVISDALGLDSDTLKAIAKILDQNQALLLPEDMDGRARRNVVGGALELEPAVLQERALALQKYKDVLLEDVSKEFWYGQIVKQALVEMDLDQLKAKAEAIKKHQALLLSEDMSESGRGFVISDALGLDSDKLKAIAKILDQNQALLLPEDMDGKDRADVIIGALSLEPLFLKERAAALQKYQDVLLQDVAKEYWYGRIVNRVLKLGSDQLEARAEFIRVFKPLSGGTTEEGPVDFLLYRTLKLENDEFKQVQRKAKSLQAIITSEMDTETRRRVGIVTHALRLTAEAIGQTPEVMRLILSQDMHPRLYDALSRGTQKQVEEILADDEFRKGSVSAAARLVRDKLAREARSAGLPPDFNPAQYLANYPDLQKAYARKKGGDKLERAMNHYKTRVLTGKEDRTYLSEAERAAQQSAFSTYASDWVDPEVDGEGAEAKMAKALKLMAKEGILWDQGKYQIADLAGLEKEARENWAKRHYITFGLGEGRTYK